MQEYYDVREFHDKFNLPQQDTPNVPDDAVRDFRVDRIQEEYDELLVALAQSDLPAIAQEGVDLIYVVLGTFAMYGIDPTPVWKAVHGANMAKAQHPDQLGKPLKPEGWRKPDYGKIIDDQRP